MPFIHTHAVHCSYEYGTLARFIERLDGLFGEPGVSSSIRIPAAASYGMGYDRIRPDIVRVQDLEIELGEYMYYVYSFMEHEIKLKRISFG